MNTTNIYLASASARRYEILQLMGITKLQTIASNIEEIQHSGETPLTYSARISLEKAKSAQIQLKQDNIIIIAADTEVVITDKILGKPRDYEHAFTMLQHLRNKQHQVISSVVILHNNIELSNTQVNNIHIGNYSDAEISHYLDNNTYLDKAGAYAIQGSFSRYIDKIEGDFFSIMGLSMNATHKLLQELRYEYY